MLENVPGLKLHPRNAKLLNGGVIKKTSNINKYCFSANLTKNENLKTATLIQPL